MKSPSPEISVVLCTYNRSQKALRCIKALQKQNLHPEKYEIVIVNDGSTDNTKSVLQKLNIKVINNSENLGLAQSRNIGVSESRANIIAFTDDDCKPDKNWLNNLLKIYTDSQIIGAGGKISPLRTNTWLLKYFEANNTLAHLTFSFDNRSSIFYTLWQYLKRSFSLRQLPNKETQLFMIIGANMSMRKSAFEAVGGFDPNIKFGGEEEDFWNRLRVILPEAKLMYIPTAIVEHDYNSSFKVALRHNYKYGFGAARLFIKDTGKIPAIYPFPIAVILSTIFVIVSPYCIIIPFLLTIILYPGWLKLTFRKKQFEYILFPPIQMALELANDFGFIKGYFKLNKMYKEPKT